MLRNKLTNYFINSLIIKMRVWKQYRDRVYTLSYYVHSFTLLYINPPNNNQTINEPPTVSNSLCCNANQIIIFHKSLFFFFSFTSFFVHPISYPFTSFSRYTWSNLLKRFACCMTGVGWYGMGCT
jgi:hypothetical protein